MPRREQASPGASPGPNPLPIADVHPPGDLLALVALPQAAAQLPACILRRFEGLGALGHPRDYVLGDLHALPEHQPGHAHPAGLPIPARETRRRALAADLCDGLDEVVEEELLDLPGAYGPRGPSDAHRHPELAPEGVPLLVAELVPALEVRAISIIAVRRRSGRGTTRASPPGAHAGEASKAGARGANEDSNEDSQSPGGPALPGAGGRLQQGGQRPRGAAGGEGVLRSGRGRVAVLRGLLEPDCGAGLGETTGGTGAGETGDPIYTT